MRKPKIATLSWLMGLLLVLQTASLSLSFVSFAAEEKEKTTVLYENDFESAEDFTVGGDSVWQNESDGNVSSPEVKDGVLSMTKATSTQFHFLNLEGFVFDPNLTYTFTFDATVTDFGNDKQVGAASTWKRELYFAPGHWFNQIELTSDLGSKAMRAGDGYAGIENYLIDVTYHMEVVWDPSSETITTTICNGDDVVISGSRQSSSYAHCEQARESCGYWGFRCEDGAVEIDNLKIVSHGVPSEITTKTVHSQDISIPADQMAIYTVSLHYQEGEDINVCTVSGGRNSLFSINGHAMKFCNHTVNRTYPTGTYQLKVTLNPEQDIAFVEAILPDGSVIRRGTYEIVGSLGKRFSIDVIAVHEDAAASVSVTTADLNENEYEIIRREPTATGFGANVYNLVTAFEDAATTRSFAWTALASFAQDKTMSVRYRKVGASEWTAVAATRHAEPSKNETEDYFKADITGLSAATEYEYQIGLTDSSSADEWSKVYRFTTAAEKVDAFTFLAIGDTQGVTWGGADGATKGFCYARTAINEAMQAFPGASFLLHTGDVVEKGGSVEMWNMYFKALGEYGATLPHFAVPGNHDLIETVNNEYKDFYFNYHFNHPNNGGNAAYDSTLNKVGISFSKTLQKNAEEMTYSFDYGNAHFICLNSGNYTGDDTLIIKSQLAWLEADLKANQDAEWLIVLVHEPTYHRLGGSESRHGFETLFESYGVDLVIQGHSHLVTRTYPMKNGKIVTQTSPDVIKKGTGTVYTTIGSTAYNHDTMGSTNVEECMTIITPHSEQPTYTAVSVESGKLVMTVRQINGYVVDRFVITSDDNYVEHDCTPKRIGEKAATCTEAGYSGDQVCEICNKTLETGTEIPATGHTYGEDGICTVCSEAKETTPTVEEAGCASAVASVPAAILTAVIAVSATALCGRSKKRK